MKYILSIAGSDCSGGAGIQADLKSIAAHGCYGATVITSVVAENTCGVSSVFNIPAEEVGKQIDSVFEDIPINAVKLGMLCSSEIVKIVSEKLRKYRPQFIVCDPVMVATSGDTLSEDNMLSAMREKIFPISTIITPNIPEAEAISGMKINSVDDMKSAAAKIAELGAKNVLIKGGHLTGDAVDILYNGQNFSEISCPRVNSQNTHGTGCTLSSAIAAELALGYSAEEAVKRAKNYITEAIRHSYTVGKGHSPVNHFYEFFDGKEKL